MSDSIDGIHIRPLEPLTSTIPSDKPVTMINLNRFRPIASYAGSSEAVEAPISGREAYMNRYVPALFSLSAKLGINVTVVYLGEAHASLFTGKAGGEGDRWDITGIIRYEKFGDFRKLTEHEDYVKEALPHRLASLEEARLVVTTELSEG